VTRFQEKPCGPKVQVALGFAVSAFGYTEVRDLALITLVLKGSNSKEGKKKHAGLGNAQAELKMRK